MNSTITQKLKDNKDVLQAFGLAAVFALGITAVMLWAQNNHEKAHTSCGASESSTAAVPTPATPVAAQPALKMVAGTCANS